MFKYQELSKFFALLLFSVMPAFWIGSGIVGAGTDFVPADGVRQSRMVLPLDAEQRTSIRNNFSGTLVLLNNRRNENRTLQFFERTSDKADVIEMPYPEIFGGRLVTVSFFFREFSSRAIPPRAGPYHI